MSPKISRELVKHRLEQAKKKFLENTGLFAHFMV